MAKKTLQNKNKKEKERAAEEATDIPRDSVVSNMSEGESTQLAPIKVLIMSAKPTGKSCLINRYLKGDSNDFQRNHDETMEFNFRKQINIKKRSYELDILDTASGNSNIMDVASERMKWIQENAAFIITFALDDRESFDWVINDPKEKKSYHNMITEIKSTLRVPVILVGTKSDCTSEERKITFQEAQEVANGFNGTYIEASALTGMGVDNVFETIAEAWYKMKHKRQSRGCGPGTSGGGCKQQ